MVTLLAALAALAACSDPVGSQPQRSEEHRVASYEGRADGAEEALLEGVLAVRNDCHWDGTSLRYGHASYAEGDQVNFSGADGGSRQGVPSPERKGLNVPAGCPEDAGIFYVQP